MDTKQKFSVILSFEISTNFKQKIKFQIPFLLIFLPVSIYLNNKFSLHSSIQLRYYNKYKQLDVIHRNSYTVTSHPVSLRGNTWVLLCLERHCWWFSDRDFLCCLRPASLAFCCSNLLLASSELEVCTGTLPSRTGALLYCTSTCVQ